MIVDSPPLLAVSDPSPIAARGDGTILVLRITRLARGAAKHATEMLKTMNANTLGVVVNGVGQSKWYGHGTRRYGGYSKGATTDMVLEGTSTRVGARVSAIREITWRARRGKLSLSAACEKSLVA